MFDTAAVKEKFGKASGHYDQHADLQREVRGGCLDLAGACWDDDAHILDAGCGTGAFAQEADEEGYDWKITGIDIAYGMCQRARARNRFTLSANAVALPFADASFDGVVSSLMLQWLDEPARALKEFARILKPGSRAVFTTFADGTLAELSQAFQSVDDLPHVSRFIAPHQFLEMAKASGFQLSMARQVRVIEYYPDTVAIMRSLQNIGATNQHTNRRRGLMTSRQLAKVEDAYQKRFAREQGLPATWEVLYTVLQKG